MGAIFRASLSLVLKFVPWDTVIAFICNYVIEKALSSDKKQGNYDKTITTVGHFAEALTVTQSFLVDGVLTPEEIKDGAELVKDLRKRLIETWAEGNPSKELEAAVRSENTDLSEQLGKVEQMTKAAEYKAAQ